DRRRAALLLIGRHLTHTAGLAGVLYRVDRLESVDALLHLLREGVVGVSGVGEYRVPAFRWHSDAVQEGRKSRSRHIRPIGMPALGRGVRVLTVWPALGGRVRHDVNLRVVRRRSTRPDVLAQTPPELTERNQILFLELLVAEAQDLVLIESALQPLKNTGRKRLREVEADNFRSHYIAYGANGEVGRMCPRWDKLLRRGHVTTSSSWLLRKVQKRAQQAELDRLELRRGSKD